MEYETFIYSLKGNYYQRDKKKSNKVKTKTVNMDNKEDLKII